MLSRRWRIGIFAAAIVMVIAALAGYLAIKLPQRGKPLAEADFGDGRIFKVEAVTYGTIHQVGVGSPLLEKFGAYIPNDLREMLEPKTPESTITRDEPALVVWLNAVDSTLRTNVDCQGVRLEIKGSDGTIYAETQPHHFAFGNTFQMFNRAGHLFRVFPRDEKTLQVSILPWRGTNRLDFTLANPGFTKPQNWKGERLPIARKVRYYEVVLHELTQQSTSGRTKSLYWRPAFELRRNGQRLEGWDLEWAAEDPWGNRGQYLGVTKSPLKFSATFYPHATNIQAAILITNTPAATLGSNEWWNISTLVGTNRVEILGLFTPGVHHFSDSEYQTNPPARFGAVRGGSPSGWVSSSRETPLRRISYHGHYSNVPVIYFRVTDPKNQDRIAVRLRDVDTGTYELAEPESQGYRDRIVPFLVKTTAKRVIVELVLLPPVAAEFLVETPSG